MLRSLCLAPLVLLPSTAMARGNCPSYLNLTSIPGFFMQDELATDPSTFDYVSQHYSLLTA